MCCRKKYLQEKYKLDNSFILKIQVNSLNSLDYLYRLVIPQAKRFHFRHIDFEQKDHFLESTFLYCKSDMIDQLIQMILDIFCWRRLDFPFLKKSGYRHHYNVLYHLYTIWLVTISALLCQSYHYILQINCQTLLSTISYLRMNINISIIYNVRSQSQLKSLR